MNFSSLTLAAEAPHQELESSLPFRSISAILAETGFDLTSASTWLFILITALFGFVVISMCTAAYKYLKNKVPSPPRTFRRRRHQRGGDFEPGPVIVYNAGEAHHVDYTSPYSQGESRTEHGSTGDHSHRGSYESHHDTDSTHHATSADSSSWFDGGTGSSGGGYDGGSSSDYGSSSCDSGGSSDSGGGGGCSSD